MPIARSWRLPALIILHICLNACGLYTPDKDPLRSDAPGKGGGTPQGLYEDHLVQHILCEVGEGILSSDKQWQLPWLREWGTTATLSVTFEDQSGLGPGVSLINPMQNVTPTFPTGGPVTLAQSFSFGLGGTASVNALRTETIQFTWRNADILEYVANASCTKFKDGVLIDGDLKLREFIYDKSEIARLGNAQLRAKGGDAWKKPVFNVFTEEVTFVAAYGASATPTWKLARVSANTNSNLLVAQRTNTNDLVITLGPIDPAKKNSYPVTLVANAMSQHNIRVQASALATSVLGQSH